MATLAVNAYYIEKYNYIENNSFEKKKNVFSKKIHKFLVKNIFSIKNLMLFNLLSLQY